MVQTKIRNDHTPLYRRISESLYLALREDPFYRSLEGDFTKSVFGPKEGMLRYYEYSMLEAERSGKLFFPGEESFGASVWKTPLDEERAQEVWDAKKSFLRTTLGVQGTQKYVQVTDTMSENAALVIKPGSWYLSILGVAPDRQGGGLGTALLVPVLEQIDQLGAAVYLETFNSRNIRFYSRFGFQEAGKFFEPAIGHQYHIMIREPSPGHRGRTP